MYRFVINLFVILIIKESVSQETTFTKFIRNDIPITSLSEQTFSSTPNTDIRKIYVVRLQSCQIGNIDEATFNQMPYLRVVFLPFNQIKNIPLRLFANNPHIKVLNFANNEIRMLQDGVFANLMLVESIIFEHNKIFRIESNVFKGLKMLKNLDLRYNHLKIMLPDMFATNIALQRLQLNGNKIDRLDDKLFANLENLVCLDLKRNQIMEIDQKAFQNLKSMVMLDLEHNYINEIQVGSFDNNTKLRQINLDENNLESLDNGLFTELMNLEILNLNANKIRLIGDNVFPPSSNLSAITLRGNQIMSLQAKTFEKLHGLRTLTVADNPWYCDCNIMDFHAYYISNENITKEMIVCYKPEKMGLRSWIDISSSELVCDLSPFEFENIQTLPVTNDTTISTEQYPPFVENALEIPSENDYENMTMERITREKIEIQSMKVDLGRSQNEDMNGNGTKLPDCFNNKPSYFDESYNKKFIEWRARFLGEFLIMYSAAKHTFNQNNVYKRSGPAMLVPNEKGFTYVDPSLNQMDWGYINEYLQEMCSITNTVLNGDSKNMVPNYEAIEEAKKLIDSLSEVVISKLKNHPNSSMLLDVKVSDNRQDVREVNKNEFDLNKIMPNLPKPNMTDGKNIVYYIINAKAEGQAHVNINTGK